MKKLILGFILLLTGYELQAAAQSLGEIGGNLDKLEEEWKCPICLESLLKAVHTTDCKKTSLFS